MHADSCTPTRAAQRVPGPHAGQIKQRCQAPLAYAPRLRVRDAMPARASLPVAARASAARLRLAAGLGAGGGAASAAAAAAASSPPRLSRPRVGVGGPPTSASLPSSGLSSAAAAPAAPAAAAPAAPAAPSAAFGAGDGGAAAATSAPAAAAAAAWRPLRLPCTHRRRVSRRPVTHTLRWRHWL